jgi:ribosome-binding protein aMBF1 (putative translation factor)
MPKPRRTATKKSRTASRNALEILDRLTGNDPQLRRQIAEETVNTQVARMVYDARERAGLTQRQLAALVATTQSVIARLEDADYGGHSLSMLRRIAEALNQRLEVRFVPTRRRHRAA